MNKLPFLLNEWKISKWAYEYCRDIKDNPEIRKLITEPDISYLYCINIKDDPEIRKNITKSNYAYLYCKNINDDPEIRKHITNKELLKELEK